MKTSKGYCIIAFVLYQAIAFSIEITRDPVFDMAPQWWKKPEDIIAYSNMKDKSIFKGAYTYNPDKTTQENARNKAILNAKRYAIESCGIPYMSESDVALLKHYNVLQEDVRFIRDQNKKIYYVIISVNNNILNNIRKRAYSYISKRSKLFKKLKRHQQTIIKKIFRARSKISSEIDRLLSNIKLLIKKNNLRIDKLYKTCNKKVESFVRGYERKINNISLYTKRETFEKQIKMAKKSIEEFSIIARQEIDKVNGEIGLIYNNIDNEISVAQDKIEIDKKELVSYINTLIDSINIKNKSLITAINTLASNVILNINDTYKNKSSIINKFVGSIKTRGNNYINRLKKTISNNKKRLLKLIENKEERYRIMHNIGWGLEEPSGIFIASCNANLISFEDIFYFRSASINLTLRKIFYRFYIKILFGGGVDAIKNYIPYKSIFSRSVYIGAMLFMVNNNGLFYGGGIKYRFISQVKYDDKFVDYDFNKFLASVGILSSDRRFEDIALKTQFYFQDEKLSYNLYGHIYFSYSLSIHGSIFKKLLSTKDMAILYNGETTTFAVKKGHSIGIGYKLNKALEIVLYYKYIENGAYINSSSSTEKDKLYSFYNDKRINITINHYF